jgi:hypothetical protein
MRDVAPPRGSGQKTAAKPLVPAGGRAGMPVTELFLRLPSAYPFGSIPFQVTISASGRRVRSNWFTAASRFG